MASQKKTSSRNLALPDERSGKQIEVRLYGDLKKYAPGDQTTFVLTLDPGATLADVLAVLEVPEGIHVSLINGRRVPENTPLKSGDVLVLFPIVSGG